MRYHQKARTWRKKIRLVQLPVAPPAAMGPTGNGALASACLAAALRGSPVTSSVDVEVMLPAVSDSLGDAALVNRLASDKPDIIGFSLYLWNIERSLYVARELRRRLPTTLMVVGGPEVGPDNTFLLDQKGFDVAVRGEGEESFTALVSRLVRNEDFEDIPGVLSRGRGAPAGFAPGPDASFSLTRHASPYLSSILPMEPRGSVYVETARGCPFRCSFCFYSRGEPNVRRLDPAALKALLWGLRGKGAEEIIILDPSFNQRPDFEELLDVLIDVNGDRALRFFAEVKADTLTEATIRRMAQAGFTEVEVGLQSVNADTLRRLGRPGDPAAVIRSAASLKSAGIRPQVDLVTGLPGDTRADIRRGVEALAEAGLADHLQMLPLFVLPGTELRRRADEEGLVFEPLPPYRVLRTREMSEDDLREAMDDAEDIMGRRLEEYPRPHLVDTDSSRRPPDVIHASLDEEGDTAVRAASQPGARHVALWIRSRDLFARRVRVRGVIERRLRIDPHAILDVVLEWNEAYPLDLLDHARSALAQGVSTFLTRQETRQGDPMQRRLCAVIPQAVRLDDDYLQHLADEVPVFREMTATEALTQAAGHAGKGVGVRILDVRMGVSAEDESMLRRLAQSVDSEAVVFASRALEAWWTREVLGYR